MTIVNVHFSTEARYPRIARMREIVGGYEMYSRHRRASIDPLPLDPAINLPSVVGCIEMLAVVGTH